MRSSAHSLKATKYRLFEFLKLKIGIYPDFTFSFKPADEEKTFGLSEKPLHAFFPERSARRSFHPHPQETHVGALMPGGDLSPRRYEGLRFAVLPFFLRKSPFLRVFRSSEAKKGGGKCFRRKGYPLRRLRPVFSGVLSFRNLNVRNGHRIKNPVQPEIHGKDQRKSDAENDFPDH